MIKQQQSLMKLGLAAGLTHRLHTMTITTTAMRKTKPAAAEPMMSGNFSWMLVLYSSVGSRNRREPAKHTAEHLREQRAAGGRVIHSASWHRHRLRGPLSKAQAMCSNAADTDKSSGRKCVKWGRRACLGETQADPAANSESRS